LVIWYISPRFGILYQEKSGNPGFNRGTLCQLPIPNVSLILSFPQQGDRIGQIFTRCGIVLTQK
jgi:hypothetical protein